MDLISEATWRAFSEVFKYTTLTEVQARTIEPGMNGCDVIAKAKTGTGKTLGFLIPSVEQVAWNPPPKGHVGCLVLSPTRELASQIAEEAKTLLTFHNPDFGVHCVVGGTNINRERTLLLKGKPPPALLVATPGRLIDHFENSGLTPLCQSLRVLVFDEADRLLDMGFRPAIDRILQQLPAKDTRQTLLFSATYPKELDEMAKVALRCTGEFKYQMIDTVGEEEVPTHLIPQAFCITELVDQLPTVMTALAEHVKQPGHKAIVFLPTSKQTAYFAATFNALYQMRVFRHACLEIHSRKTQAQRTRVSQEFRDAREAILFTSDVSARGVDYPNVTLVVQCGLPASREDYVHRLGRTARAGKTGQGLLILANFEQTFLRQLKDLPMKQTSFNESEVKRMSDTSWDAIPLVDKENPELAAQVYLAWLGFYKDKSKVTSWGKDDVIAWANYYAQECLGLPELPGIKKSVASKMGFKVGKNGTYPGLVIIPGC